MLIKQILLATLGLSSGMTVAGGLFALISGLGIVSDLADRTQTAQHVLLYENCIMAGAILGNIFFLFQLSAPWGGWILPIYGLFSGIFVGCWAMALGEALNLFPIFVRRVKLVKGVPYFVLAMGLGRGVGALLYYWNRW